MNNTFLQLLEGMTDAQVRQFRKAIIPTLRTLRREIIEGTRARIVPAWMTNPSPKPRRSRSAARSSR